MKQKPSHPSLTLTPIGFVRTSMRLKFDAPHQAIDPHAVGGEIELVGGQSFEAALQDLEGIERIWLIWWFHKNSTWHPKVLPPRGPRQKRGVFATRSPHRPNPVGITAVQLLGIKGRRLLIGPCDLVDGTPILDIKPYIPSADSFPDSATGWIGEVEHSLQNPPAFDVQCAPEAREQLTWLANTRNITFFDRAKDILSVDPSPHRTRRIVELPSGERRMSCGAWRLFFNVRGTTVMISRVACGYPLRSLSDRSKGKAIPDREHQLSFLERWPE